MTFTRGFKGRRARDPRLPPGQYDVGKDWPVLTAEATPQLSTDKWTFGIDGLVEKTVTWTWAEIMALPKSRVHEGDIHCVTTWSKLGVRFRGRLGGHAAGGGPAAAVGDATCWPASTTGYTTNLPLDDMTGGQGLGGWEHDGEPLAREHGGPARLLVPHLYFWKSAKWVSGLQLLDHDEPGFWERNGYHDRGDPWKEQRYQGGLTGACRSGTGRGRWPTSTGSARDVDGQDVPAGAADPEPYCRAALPRPADRAGRVRGPAVVLGGLGPGGSAPRRRSS